MPPSPLVNSRNWVMSVPATNARPPAPRSTSTRTPSSSSARLQASSSPSYIANVIALRASGRLNSTVSTAPSWVTSRSLTAGLLRADRIDDLGGDAGPGEHRAGVGAQRRARDPTDGGGAREAHG